MMKSQIDSQFKALFNCLPLAVFMKDIRDNYKFLLWNKTAEAAWGFKESDLLGRTDYDLFPKDQADFFRKMDLQATSGKSIVYIPEEKLVNAAGEMCWLRTWKIVSCDDDGTPSILIGISQDITQIKKADEEIQIHQKQIQNISDNAPGILYQFKATPDNQLSFTYFSRRLKEVIGLEPTEIVQDFSWMYKLVHPADLASFTTSIQRAIAHRANWHWEGRVNTLYDKTLYIKGQSTAYSVGDGSTYWDGLLIDVTQIRENEALLLKQTRKMHEAARLISLGEMAGGIAHEINTPLGSISIMAELASRELQKPQMNKEKVLKTIQQINDMVFRISKIVKAMRAYSRKDSSEEIENISFDLILDDVLAVCQHRVKMEQIHLEAIGFNEDIYLSCQPVQVAQILLNLINNSCDAIKHLPEKWIRIQYRGHRGNWIEIAVTDSGSGINPEIADDIFKNFFTTKNAKDGTGLGLSMVKNIMKVHGGAVYLDRQAKNTTFILRFPKKLKRAA